MNIEIIGYLSTAIILLSFGLSDLRKLRMTHILGTAGWIIYGVMAGASSIIIGNSIMILVHFYKIYRESK